MPFQKVPLTGASYPSLNEQFLDTRSAVVRNLYVNEFDYSEKRPGLMELLDLGTARGIDGLYWWDVAQKAVVVSNGRVWTIDDALGNTTELTSGDLLQIGTPTTFDDNGTTLFMANGGKILSSTSSGPAAYIADADAPTAVTHVAFLDQYIIANLSGTGSFQFSEVADPTAWRAIDIATAETKPDITKALHVGLGEIAHFGTKSIEFWLNDGVSPFARINGATIERGILAPYSVALVNDRWIALDDRRRVIVIDRRQPVEVSMPVHHVLQSLSSVETAIGQVYTIEGLPLYVLSFPQDNRTLVYNILKNDWTEWDYWDQTEATTRRFRGNAYCYASRWNLHLVGDHSNGKVYCAKPSVYQDISGPIRCVRRTGFITHGTDQEKESRSLRIKVKRSVATAAAPNPQIMLRYRNNGGAWSNELWRNLGPVGDHENYVTWESLGQYRARQYEIAFTDNAPFEMAGAEEDVEVMR